MIGALLRSSCPRLPDVPDDWKGNDLPNPGEATRGGLRAPMETGRGIPTAGGRQEDAPPEDEAGFMAFVRVRARRQSTMR